MRIAQVSPLFESVPPASYGGTERVVSYLTEELTRRGHELTLFASGDSRTAARLTGPCAEALRSSHKYQDPIIYHMLMLEQLWRARHEFDIIHFHIDYLHFLRTRAARWPCVTTLHGRLDLPDLPALFEEYSEMPLISISDAQREPLPWLNWLGTVHHGLPRDLYTLQPQAGHFAAFLGRVSPEKGLDRAIEISRRAGIPLRVAAKVDSKDRVYFEQVIEPQLKQSPHVEFLGEINDLEKQEFLGGALALLFPIDWPEPFGLVMIEAMACGTPVIAFRSGSVIEVMEEGRSGFIVSNIEEAVAALMKASDFDRGRCRAVFEERFTVETMADHYLDIYADVVESRWACGAEEIDGRVHSTEGSSLRSGNFVAR